MAISRKWVKSKKLAIQRCGWAARFLGEVPRPEKNNPSTWENPPRFWLPFNLPGKLVARPAPKADRFINGVVRPLLRLIEV